jgi:serine protease
MKSVKSRLFTHAHHRWGARLGGLLLCGVGAMACATAAETLAASSPARLVTQEQGRVIVKFRAGGMATRATASAAQAGPQQAAALSMRLSLRLKNGRALSQRSQVLMAQGMSSAALVQALAKHPDVEWVVPDVRRFVQAVPNDPLFPGGQTVITPNVGQWYLRSPDATLVSAINASKAWDRTKGSANVVVAVLDTGVSSRHLDLSGKVLPGYDFVGFGAPAIGYSASDALAYANDGDLEDSDAQDPGDWVSKAEAGTGAFKDCAESVSSWHGTKVSGLVGANTHNGQGIAGAGWDTKVLPVRVLGKCGGWDSEIIAGMKWAAGVFVPGVPSNPNPAKVINLSLGSSGPCGAAYAETVAMLDARKVTVVVAAGNDGLTLGAPANCSGVISVAGVRHTGTKVDYSSLGPNVVIAAPAGNCTQDLGACRYGLITTTNVGTTTPLPLLSLYTSGENPAVGTSFSAPLVSATVALMLSIKPDASPQQIMDALRTSARPFPQSGAGLAVSACRAPSSVAQSSECYCTTSTCGAGMLDAAEAVATMAGGAPLAVFSASTTAPAVGTTVSLDGSASQASSGRTLVGFQWDITAGASSANLVGSNSAPTVVLNPLAAGAVTVQLTVTDNTGATHVSSQSLNIAAAPVVPVTPPTAVFTATPAAPIVGTLVSLNGRDSTAAAGRRLTSFQWAIVAGSSLASFSGATNSIVATLNTTAAGSVTVQLTVTDDLGATHVSSQTLSIAAAPTPAPAPTPPAAESGGGSWGTAGLVLLALCAALLGRRRTR